MDSFPRGCLLPVVAAALVTLVIVMLYPPGWSPADDTKVLREAHELGLAALWTPYANYLAVAQRAVSLVWDPDPFRIGALGSYLAVFAVGVFLAWRVHPVAPLVLLAPAVSVYGTLSNIQWVLAVYLLGMLVATPPTSVLGRWADALGLLVCGLTGPYAILFLPLYAVRAWKEPAWRWHLSVLGVAAVIQAYFIATWPREPAPGHDILAVMLARDALPVAIILLTALWLPRSRVVAALYVAVTIALLGILATYHTTTELLAGDGQRYFYLPWVVALGMVAMTAQRVTLSRQASHVPVSP